jgi:hypothetical protein
MVERVLAREPFWQGLTLLLPLVLTLVLTLVPTPVFGGLGESLVPP